MWKQAEKNSSPQELRNKAIRDSQAADASGRRATLRNEVDNDLSMEDDVEMPDDDNLHRFDFDFKSLQKPFQKMLYQHHDQLRKDVTSLWNARKQFEAILEEYTKFKETGCAPMFADSFQVPKCVLGVQFPVAEGPCAGKSIQEVIDSFKDSQLATKVDHMVCQSEAGRCRFLQSQSQPKCLCTCHP